MSFLRVRNFEKFQHYKHRNPPWIRLYRDLLSDQDFYKLPGVLKFQIVGLTLLASETDNRIPEDAEWIQAKILSVEAVDIKALMETTFIEPCKQRASKTPATKKRVDSKLHQNHASETDNTETESETDNTETLALDMEFQTLMRRYPLKDGVKEAKRHFMASVKTRADVQAINKALDSYLHHLQLNDWKRPKSAKTWFNNWRDWVDFQEPNQGRPKLGIVPPVANPTYHQPGLAHWCSYCTERHRFTCNDAECCYSERDDVPCSAAIEEHESNNRAKVATKGE